MTAPREPRRRETPDERAARLRARVEEAPTISMEEYRRKSRRSFLGFGIFGAASYLGFRHVQNRPEVDNIPDVLRRGLEFNEDVWTTFGSDTRRSRTYSISDREDIRVNGRIGIRDELDAAAWSIAVFGIDGEEIDRLVLDDIRALPAHDMVWMHKCIEGWSNVVHWTGARFSDLQARYVEAGAIPADHGFVSFRTPDERYYVGLDRETATHSQTLLAWALNGEELTEGHGAPLRLASPVVYGIKQLKRIGVIEFTNTRPRDYWAERGYDWHARF